MTQAAVVNTTTIQLQTANLQNLVKRVAPAIPDNSPMQVLNTVLLKFNSADSALEAIGTNLSITAAFNCPASGDQDVSICLPAGLFKDFLTTVTAQDVQLVVDTAAWSARLIAVGTNLEIRGIDADEYPDTHLLHKQEFTRLPGAELQRALSEVVVCAKSEGQTIICGVNFEFQKDGLVLRAVDGFRLAQVEIGGIANSLERSFVVPIDGAKLIAQSFDGGDVDVVVSENESALLFRQGELLITTRLLDGKFPDVARIVPKPEHLQTRVAVAKRELELACARSVLVSKSGTGGREIVLASTFTVGGGMLPELVITGKQAEIGSNRTALVAEIEGSDNFTQLNPKYMQEILSAMRPGVTRIRLSMNNDADKSVRERFGIRVEAADGNSPAFYIIMPMYVR